MKKYVKKKGYAGLSKEPSTPNGGDENITSVDQQHDSSTSLRQSFKRKVNIGLRLTSFVNPKTTNSSTSKLQYLRDMVSSKLRPCVKKRKSVDDKAIYSTVHALHGTSMSSSPKKSRYVNNASNTLNYSASLRNYKHCKTPVKLQSKYKTLDTLNQSFGGHGRLLFGSNDYTSSQLTPHLESSEQNFIMTNQNALCSNVDAENQQTTVNTFATKNQQVTLSSNGVVTQDMIQAVQSNYNLSKDFVLTSEGLKKVVVLKGMSNMPMNMTEMTTSFPNIQTNMHTMTTHLTNIQNIPNMGAFGNSSGGSGSSLANSHFHNDSSRPNSSQSLYNHPNSSQSLYNHPYPTRIRQGSDSYNYGQQITLTSEDETAGYFYGSTRKISSTNSRSHMNNNDSRHCINNIQQPNMVDEQHFINTEQQNVLGNTIEDDLAYICDSHMHSTLNHYYKNSFSTNIYYNNSEDTLNDIILRNQIKTTLQQNSSNFNNFNNNNNNNNLNPNNLLNSNGFLNMNQFSTKCCYSAETWESMINSENLITPRYFYLKKQKYVSIKTRAILLGWLAEVCDAFKMQRDTYYLAINYIDRYLSATSDVRCNQLQLLGISALYMAAKLEEIYPPNLQRFVNVTDGATTLEQVLIQELALVKTLKWQLNEMTAYSWLALFVLTFENYQLLQPPHVNNCRTHPKTRGHEKRLSNRGQWKMRCLEFPTTAFKEIVHITKLLEVVMLDAESLKYTSIVLAASIFFICRNYDESVLDFTGISFRQIEHCVNWMNMYSGVVRGRKPSPTVMNTSLLSASNSTSSKSPLNNSFNIIYSSNDENYTIQRHRDSLKYFENYQLKARTEQVIANITNSIIVDKCYR